MLKAIHQSQSWADFIQSLPHRSSFKIDGFFAYKLFLSKKLKLSFLYLPGINSLPRKKTLTKLINLCKEEEISFIHFEPYFNQNKQISGSIKSPISYIEKTTRILDLKKFKNKDQILAQMKSKGRYNIRLAQKKNIQIKVETTTENFYNLLVDTGNRDHFHINPINYYQNLINKLGKKATILTAFHENKAIASIILIESENTLIYYYGASSNQDRELMAPYLLQWEGICLALEKKLDYYDFLGIAPNDSKSHPLQGVTRFKSMFGGETIQFDQAFDLPIAKTKYYCYFIYKFMRNFLRKK